jgi:integrase
MQALLRDIDATDGQAPRHERNTFAELCDYFEKHYVKAAEYVEGRKVSGVRSLATAKGQLSVLRDHFGVRQLRSITHADVREFRATRLAQKTRTDGQRSIASVNRELSMLRRMFNVAQREGWILKNPFGSGDSLISVADEQKRERILTRAEETKLLAACETSQRAHLKGILICALDTGMRQGEIFSLRWRDVDIENGLVNIQAFHTKTMKERQVAMTTRLALELEQLKASAPDNPNGLVFGINDNVKRSFGAARSDAGLQDLRFHDLRHTAATRLVGAHVPLSEVGRVLGHTQANTTYRYVNANIETAKRAAAALDAFNAEETLQPERVEMVN